MNKVLHSSAKGAWRTPQEVIDLVMTVDRIRLDPCAHHESCFRVPVEYHLDEGRNGLALSWSPDSNGSLLPPFANLVYINPPYGRGLLRWANKIAWEAGQQNEIITLIPARTDTQWWRALWRSAAAVAFWQGRLQFIGALYPAPFPSALFYHGLHIERFVSAFEDHCLIARL